MTSGCAEDALEAAPAAVEVAEAAEAPTSCHRYVLRYSECNCKDKGWSGWRDQIKRSSSVSSGTCSY